MELLYESAEYAILRDGPYRFFFVSQDVDEPPHIHVARDRSLAKFWIVPVRLAYNKGFPAHELNALSRVVQDGERLFLERWNDFFGT